MTKRLKRPRDPVSLAKLIGDIATGQVHESDQTAENPATELARLGGIKGGKARAKKLSAKRRAEIAKKAALMRWAARTR